MGQDESQVGADVDEQRTPEEIKRDIEQTREELGETVAAVAEKADVKKQAKAKVSGAKEGAKAKLAGAKTKAAETAQQTTAKVQAATPEPAAAGTQQASQRARQFAEENPTQVALGAGVLAGLVLGWLLARR